MNYKQIFAKEQANKNRILKVCPTIEEKPGIYFLTREQNGFKFAYIGQSKNILKRLAQHLIGYQHIDVSLKKHKLFSDDNVYGWKIAFEYFEIDQLDEMEQKYIKEYADKGYQLRNETTGSQGVGKKALDGNRQPKGYRAGIEQGKKNLAKEMKNIIDKHLVIAKKKDSALSQKAFEKFNALLDYGTEEKEQLK